LTIAGVFDERPHDEARTQSLIESAHAWELAIQSLRFAIDPIRAWKEPEYREQLTQSEKESIAHPAGEIDLSQTFLGSARPLAEGGGAGEQSASVVAVCCSTEGGDLCTVISSGSDYCCITASGLTCTCRYLCP
jgi:mersacidin/lichenicidin family type 2 lantibiotic